MQHDRAYRPALVVTTYYDTPDLELLDEKINSDHLKTKVRVRWYAPLDGGPPVGPVFVECKNREGATRQKRRVMAQVQPMQLAAVSLAAPEWGRLLTAAAGRGPGSAGGSGARAAAGVCASPVRGFRGGARISLDAGMVVQAVNPARLHRRRGSARCQTRCSIKGHGPDLPAHVAPVTRLGARRSAFSRYLACYQHVTRETF